MFRSLAILLALTLAACATEIKLAKCQGPLIIMNQDKWRPTAADVAAFDKICPEDH